MECALSVIIPAYNRDYIIGKTLDSMFRQTLKDMEIIVVDDGSDDNTVGVVKEYQKAHKNLFLYTPGHGGPGPARNVGLQHARGEYVTFMDSDDWAPETAYEKMYHRAKERDADIIVGQYLRKINGGAWTLPVMFQEFWQRFGDENCVGNGAMVIAIRNPNGVNKIFRRELLLKNNICFPSTLMAEDMAFTISAFECAKSVYLLDEVVYMYESNLAQKNSLVSAPSAESIIGGLSAMMRLGLTFHERGMIEEQELTLEHSFQFILTRFNMMPEGKEKSRVFESVKEYVSLYKGLKEYQVTLEYLFHMDIDTMLLLPYPTYVRQINLMQSNPSTGTSAARGGNAWGGEDYKEKVLTMYQNGEIGFRYILRYFKAWLRFKLKGKK